MEAMQQSCVFARFALVHVRVLTTDDFFGLAHEALSFRNATLKFLALIFERGLLSFPSKFHAFKIQQQNSVA